MILFRLIKTVDDNNQSCFYFRYIAMYVYIIFAFAFFLPPKNQNSYSPATTFQKLKDTACS